MKNLFLLSALLILAGSAFCQDFSGTYTSNQITLTLEKNEAGIYNGSLSGNNNVFRLSGQVSNGQLNGRIGEESSGLIFVASQQNQVLVFTMGELDMSGNLNTATARTLTFMKTSVTSGSITPGTGGVIINNTALSASQLQEIKKRYGIEPKPGNYWYDTVSGLYGVTGYPSYGFMYPGHSFGTLNRNASAGNTGVLINGRELPQLEWAIWSYIIGYYVQPGSYWLDAQGNVGYQGINVPVLNLFVLARQNSYNGKGGGGDNFWSSRFGAGNSNADNSQGYVSVPGYGPVGYGF
jgi:hypothetical protein